MMDTVVKASRIAGTLVLCVTEVILVGLFITAVSRNNAHFIDAACLLFHCFALFTILSTIIYSMFNGSRNPADKFYVLSTCFLAVATSISFLLVVIDAAKMTPNDFAGLGQSAADAVIALSFLVVLLAMLAFGIALYEKLHDAPSPIPLKHDSAAMANSENNYYEAKRTHSGVNSARAALASKQSTANSSVPSGSGRPASVHFEISDFRHVEHMGLDALERPTDPAGMEEVPLTPLNASSHSEETVRPAVPEKSHDPSTSKHRQMSYDMKYWSSVGQAV